MTKRRFLIAIFAGVLVSAPAMAQRGARGQRGAAPRPPQPAPPPGVWDSRDFNGLWMTSTTDITEDLQTGQEISFTKKGADSYRKIGAAPPAPANTCNPYGPTRAMQSGSPYQIVQTPPIIAVIFENVDYRLIYADGSDHPDDIANHPEWNGHSTGRWDGDALVVDTVSIKAGSWIDASGFEHSDKMHLIERFEKSDPDTFRWTVTVEDPEFFTKPFTYQRTVKRQKDTRIVPARCVDSEKDAVHARANTKVLKFPD